MQHDFLTQYLSPVLKERTEATGIAIRLPFLHVVAEKVVKVNGGNFGHRVTPGHNSLFRNKKKIRIYYYYLPKR